MMHELHTSIFASLLPRPSCTGCGAAQGTCDSGLSITSNGSVSRPDDPTAVVSWPRCPASYAVMREAGQDLLPLSHHVAYAHDCGVHQSPTLGAGGHRLIREWARCRDLPARLHEARASAEMRKKREAAQ